MRFTSLKLAGPLALLALVCCPGSGSGETIWTGPSTTFVKVPFEDFNNPISQDRLTDNVWITRKNTMGLFNIKTEAGFVAGSPADTEWSFGTTADIGSLTFADWKTWNGSNPPGTVGQDAVLHLISDDIFLDIKFIGWSQGAAGGGGFGYERSTPELVTAQIGDTNDDALVNIDDLNNVRNNFGAMGPDDGTLDGDAVPFDGMVDIVDLNAVRNNFGAGAAAVPEPAGFALALLSASMFHIARRRRKIRIRVPM